MKMMKLIFRKFLEIYWQRKLNVCSSGVSFWVNEILLDYRLKRSSFVNLYRIHRRGFTYTDWTIMGLNKDNYKSYLSNAAYYAMHPINGRYSAWIDDKLTLKYLCAGTSLDKYMPKYYYLVDNNGKIHKLMDSKSEGKTCIENIMRLLETEGALAVKKIAGSIGEGFYCFKYEKETGYSINGTDVSKEQLIDETRKLRDYIITEYLFPHDEIAVFSKNVVNCIRYLAGNMNGNPIMIKSYIRFGTKASGYVENYNAGGILCYINENGEFKEGNILESGRNKIITNHIDSNYPLQGVIPFWSEIKATVDEFFQYFPMLKYLGFDFAITKNNQIKILEINSLTSLDALELYTSLYDTDAGDFYKYAKTNNV